MNEQGCAFCKNYKPMITRNNGAVYIVQGLETQKSEAKIFHALDITCSTGEKGDILRINYCPMCGRKLGGLTNA